MLKLSSKVTKCITLGLALNLVGCQTNLLQEVLPQNTNATSGRLEQTVKSYSGEELFRGIFFLQGEVANKLPSLYSIQTEVKDANIKAQKLLLADEIIEGIKKIDSNFLSWFKVEIESDDYNRIEDALKKGSEIYLKAGLTTEHFGSLFSKMATVAQSIDVSKYNLKTAKGLEQLQDDMKEGLGRGDSSIDDGDICLVVAAVVAVAVWEVVAAVNVAVVLTFYAWVLVAGADGGERGSTLKKEIMIAEIAANI